ncbi:hypothetical protein ILP92_11760 [Maribius pontilimi]|uniref:YtxH domain-containing protein n=1 Tax=Palleronia pontilimi TaxID=1964209 RepID=A0A934II15_9RHOB|nr:hypothetical protein [Palleronia pontilimi]MBJ3763422.1 hypothetical protein [Palleronia pontilimi]
MSPLTRNIALAAAALAIPAALAAAAGPDRVRRLPGQVRDLWHDDSVEGQLKRLTARLNELGEDLHIHSSRNEDLARIGRIAAIVGAILVVPAALAAWIGPKKIRDTVREYRDDWAGSGDSVSFEGVADDLADLEDDIEQQREDAFDAVTSAAQDQRH